MRAIILAAGRGLLSSVLTVHTVGESMTQGGEVLLMDADVLYAERVPQLQPLAGDTDPMKAFLRQTDRPS